MKLIILEGQDNLGKTTIIREICKNYKSFIVRKFSNPPKDLPLSEKEQFQKDNFLQEFRFYTNMCKLGIFDPKESIMIWDRSHLGEQVYGPLYRKTNPTKWLKELESRFKLDKMHLILLQGHYDFVIGNEDGLSLTMNEERFKEFINEFNSDDKSLNDTILGISQQLGLTINQKIKKIEALLFLYGFNNSIIPNKLKVKVDLSDEIKEARRPIARDLAWHGIDTSGFRSINDIILEVKQFINE